MVTLSLASYLVGCVMVVIAGVMQHTPDRVRNLLLAANFFVLSALYWK